MRSPASGTPSSVLRLEQAYINLAGFLPCFSVSKNKRRPSAVGVGLWLGLGGWIVFLMALMLLHLHYSKPKTQKPREAERHSIQRLIPWAEPYAAPSCQA
jgi:hypothetical protein